MKKETYLKKLAQVETRLGDEATLGELRAQKKTRRELERFWERKASEWMERHGKTDGQSFKDYQASWRDIKFEYNLKPTGGVTVKVRSAAEGSAPARFLYDIRIKKSELLS